MPFTLLIIFVLLYLVFGRLDEALLIMGTLPLALIGGFWLLYLLGYNLSVAGVVGFIALAGVAAEFGVIMLLYLKQAWSEREDKGEASVSALLEAIQEGAVLRVRPKAMTVAVILAGLIPIMWSHGTGSEVMQRIAAPMVGGMVTAPLLSLFVVPAVYLLIRDVRQKPIHFPPTPHFKRNHNETRQDFRIHACPRCRPGAFAATSMDGMDMKSMGGKEMKSSTASPQTPQPVAAEIRKIDPNAGKVTLKHGPIENLGMSAMTMAFPVKDRASLKNFKEGDSVLATFDKVDGKPTIVDMRRP